jgi:hypothetical protein
LILSITLFASGQDDRASLVVTVNDINNDPLPGVVVVISNDEGEFSGVTDEYGKSRLSNVKAGTYTMTVTMTGFQTEKQEIILEPQQTSKVSVTLEVESMEEPM